jgi:hypothetical protein
MPMDTLVRRLGIAALALTTIGGSFAAGAAWGGDEPVRSGRLTAAPQRPPAPPPDAALQPARTCQELLDWYVENTIDQVTEYGWGGGRFFPAVVEDRASMVVPLGDAAESASAPGFRSQSSSETGTNVQEVGVDEPDVVKTDGELLVRIEGDELTVYDVSEARVVRVGRIRVPGRADRRDLLLVGDQVVVLGTAYTQVRQWDVGLAPAVRTVVHRVDLGDPVAPRVLDAQTYDAELISARQYGDTVRLVLSTGLPELDFVTPDRDRGRRAALRENRRLVRESTIEDWLPSVSDDGADAEMLAGCHEMSIPEEFSGGGSVTVVGYHPDDPTDRAVDGVATSSTTVYSATDRLYLATGGFGFGSCCWEPLGRRVIPTDDAGTTQLHAFELDGDDASYVASGEVEGYVRDRWAMDAADGVLRVAVGPSSETGPFNSVVTLAERDGELVELGRVGRLGVNEEIKSVRWFDDLAFVVTFRQIDPLYAIDLSDPARPRRLGELKIPGFSEYLHPLDGDLLLGVGTDASLDGRVRGGQVAVFDVSDLSHPRRVDTVAYGRERITQAGQDPRQFTWLPGRRTALTVVAAWGDTGGATGWVSVLTVGRDGQLRNRMVKGAYGFEDVANLRTVPLPDDRVVLVAEDTARFLRL